MRTILLLMRALFLIILALVVTLKLSGLASFTDTICIIACVALGIFSSYHLTTKV